MTFIVVGLFVAGCQLILNDVNNGVISDSAGAQLIKLIIVDPSKTSQPLTLLNGVYK